MHQIASTTPNGQAPDWNPYALARAQPTANASTNPMWRRSSAYMTIMKVSAVTPKAVSTAGVFQEGLAGHLGRHERPLSADWTNRTRRGVPRR